MALKNIVLSAIDKEIGKYAKKMETVAKDEAHVKSGALQDSISTEKVSEGRYLVGVDTAKLKADPRNPGGVDYSVPYHSGHRTYVIRAKEGKVLRWVGKDGKVHFAKSVTIPASAGDPFIERAVLKRPKL